MKSETMWDGLAKDWDKPGVNLGQNDLRIIEKTKKYLNAGDIVLDYGCATGSVSIEIAKMVEEIHGIDLSANMIERARRKAEEQKIHNANFMHATIFDENLKQESFDVILAFSILHLLENSLQVMDRINQLLKPGGLFISASPFLGEKTIVSMLLKMPVIFLSKIGILPYINFFSISKIEMLITRDNFQIIENESLSIRPITECFMVARKS